MDWPYKNHKKEDWGANVNKLDFNLLYAVDQWIETARSYTGNPNVLYHVNAAFATEGHSENSQHYLGNASDGYLYSGNVPLSLETQFITAVQCGFNGIGLYPEWNTHGLHVDVRRAAWPTVKKIWIEKSKIYYPLKLEDWMKIGIKK